MEHNHTKSHRSTKPDSGVLKDPVCGMSVTEQSPHRCDRQGRMYYFCSGRCQTTFLATLDKYITKTSAQHGDSHAHSQGAKPQHQQVHNAAQQPASEAISGAIYTCPMRPEICQEQLGNCPKCGMALEPFWSFYPEIVQDRKISF